MFGSAMAMASRKDTATVDGCLLKRSKLSLDIEQPASCFNV